MSVQTLDGTDRALLDAARALVPRVRACADENERERQLPQSLADALAAAGLFKLTVPRALGGAEAHPETVVRVIETLAAADGSAGWSAGIAAQCGIASGFFGAEAARAVYGDPPAFVALVTFRAGRAQAVDGGYRVTGRWSFASGCRHATWLGGGAIIYDWEQPRLGADGQPESRFFFFTAVACEIFDTWHVTGLRGTGSHEFAVADAFARLAILPSDTDHDNVDRGVVEALRAAFGDLVSEPVPHSVTMKRSMNSRLPIVRYDPQATATLPYRALASRVLAVTTGPAGREVAHAPA